MGDFRQLISHRFPNWASFFSKSLHPRSYCTVNGLKQSAISKVRILPTLSTLISILGLMILYQRYIHHINHLLPSKLPVRQNGWVKEAEGVKYVSRVLRWVEGGDCVKRWITWGISASVTGSADGVLDWK